MSAKAATRLHKLARELQKVDRRFTEDELSQILEDADAALVPGIALLVKQLVWQIRAMSFGKPPHG